MPASTAPMAHASEPFNGSEGTPASQRSPVAYSFGGRPTRMIALMATVLVHLAVGAVVAIGWQHAQSHGDSGHLTSVIILPRPADEHRHRPETGTRAAVAKSDPRPAPSAPPPIILLAPPSPLVPVAIETVAAIPAPVAGGSEDALDLATQAYRRAIMARLEAQQRRTTKADGVPGLPDDGTILFRIGRSGDLLEATIGRTTGSVLLDRAALSLVRRAAPFPAIPDGLPDELTITLPLEFLIAPKVARR